MAPPTESSTSTLFDERLIVPWWAWLATLGVTSGLAAELAIGAYALRHWFTFALAGALGAAALVALSRVRIRVRQENGQLVLRVDDAWLPASVIAGVTPLDAAGRRDILGVSAEPLAFVVQRPWIAGGVRIDLDDPEDPTPYWFVSTRHPDRLVEKLSRR